MLNVSRRNSSSELYKVTPTRGIERIYKFIDPNRDALLSSFQNYDLKQINDYIEINRQTEEEKAARLKVWNVLRRVTEPCVTDGYLALGGSTLSKLATKGADLDLCFAVRCTEGEYEEEGVNHHILERICAGLEDLVGKAIDGVQIRRIEKVNARVPILKLNLRIPYDLIPVDINANCVAGIYNSHLLFYYARLDERFVHMNMILKEWGKVNDVIQPRFGKLNSYTVSLMIIHFLQCGVNPPILPNLYALFPQHFEGKIDVNKLDYNLRLELPKISRNDRTVGELIYGFFEYYCRFNYDDWGISIKEGRIFDRRNQPEEERQYLFFLEEAYDGMTVPKNLTRRYKLADILTKFKDGRPLILRDICKPFSPPAIDTAWDFVCQLEDENGRNVHQNNNLDGRI